MKVARICDLLSAAAEVAVGIGQDRTVEATLRNLRSALSPFAKREIDEVFSLSFSSDEQPSSTSGTRLQSGAEFLAALMPVLNALVAPSAKRKFKQFSEFLSEHAQMDAHSFTQAIAQGLVPNAPTPKSGQSLIGAYVEALRNALHDDERFPLVYAALVGDPRLSKEAIVDVACGFAYQMAKSTGRKTALERIWKVHDASQAYADKAKAMKGRSAS